MVNVIPAIHQLFLFLGQPGGELVKHFVELILFLIVDYMIISEYQRNRKEEYKFLIIAFSALAIQRFIQGLFLFISVFSSEVYLSSGTVFINNILEVLALFLVAVAFLYPAFKDKRSLNELVVRKGGFVLGFSALFSILAFLVFDLKGLSLEGFFSNTIFLIVKIMILYTAVILVFGNWGQFFNYRANITMAFIVYSVTPLLLLINVIFFQGMEARLIVAGHPFPFLAVLLFTRVIYLKLVDKVSLRTQLRISRRKYQQELEVSKLKDEFISVVSHELRTPITSIKLYLGLLKEGKLGKLVKKQKDALNIVDDETNRLNALIGDVLDLSRLESKKVNVNKELFDLNAIVKNKLYMNMAREKGVKVINNIPKKFKAYGDAAKFKQVFINLFTNSLKFTPKKGKIVLSAQSNNDSWKFIITDTGKGIENDKLPYLFDKFYQADESMTRKQGGFGLGLAIIKKIVDMHGGEIHVKSEVGKGTTFVLQFPRK